MFKLASCFTVPCACCLSFLVIESQNKANKDRLRNLQKARNVFQDHLGLEIRTILGKSQLVRGVPCAKTFSSFFHFQY